MPLSATSRYYMLPVYAATDARGQARPTVPIRPPAGPPAGTALYQHVVTGIEDIEYLAWRYFGSSAAWWRIAEANALAFPLDLNPSETLNIPSPSDVGQIPRRRLF